MTEQHKKFLHLAIVEQKKYSEIQLEMNIDKATISKWWNDLKTEREQLSESRKIWKRKCSELEFLQFKDWLDRSVKRCHYCGITEPEIKSLIDNGKIYTKRLTTRGRKLEIERVLPNEKYDNVTNLVYCCYWCNNAKSDEFSKAEFESIGATISLIWQKRKM